MKIAIPTKEKHPDSPVSPTFGRANHFMLFDTETGLCQPMDDGAKDSINGAGICAAQNMVDEKINVLIAHNCGMNAYQVLKEEQILVYQAVEGSASENLSKFLDGKLSLMTAFRPSIHN